MDLQHQFHTRETFTWVRAEHIGLLLALTILGVEHLTAIHWGRFAAAFLLIDVIGYLPGALAHRRSQGRAVSPLFHGLYNVTHSYLTAAVVVGGWSLALGHLEWAMLAIPIHLSGDRGLFGNTYKPASLPFEPGPASSALERV